MKSLNDKFKYQLLIDGYEIAWISDLSITYDCDSGIIIEEIPLEFQNVESMLQNNKETDNNR